MNLCKCRAQSYMGMNLLHLTMLVIQVNRSHFNSINSAPFLHFLPRNQQLANTSSTSASSQPMLKRKRRSRWGETEESSLTPATQTAYHGNAPSVIRAAKAAAEAAAVAAAAAAEHSQPMSNFEEQEREKQRLEQQEVRRLCSNRIFMKISVHRNTDRQIDMHFTTIHKLLTSI